MSQVMRIGQILDTTADVECRYGRKARGMSDCLHASHVLLEATIFVCCQIKKLGPYLVVRGLLTVWPEPYFLWTGTGTWWFQERMGEMGEGPCMGHSALSQGSIHALEEQWSLLLFFVLCPNTRQKSSEERLIMVYYFSAQDAAVWPPAAGQIVKAAWDVVVEASCSCYSQHKATGVIGRGWG